MVSAREGNDIFYLKGGTSHIANILEPSGIDHGSFFFGGPGKDYLILESSLEDWDTKLEYDGFDIKPWGTNGGWLRAGDIEVVQGRDFMWKYGDRFPTMGAPPPKDVTDSNKFNNNFVPND